MSTNVSGTEGYAEASGALIERWRRMPFDERHAPVLHLIPDMASNIADIGAGAGDDAAALAARGHRVVAVEPVDALRAAAIGQYPSPRITWLDDSLPDLAVLLSTRQTFDVVMLTAVWMHLDDAQRRRAMPNVGWLVRDGGVLIVSLRHGPVPAGRRMFDVSAQETIELACDRGLRPVLNLQTESVQPENRRAGVTWTRLAFVKGDRRVPLHAHQDGA
ncbi:class I SAM-dependent methyltransferase [Burkholderia sp. MR1-5-21]